MHPLIRVIALLPWLASLGCGAPEVIVVNEMGEDVLVRAISFHGCKWDVVLAHEQATSPQFCLAGEDRIHFQRFHAGEYCERQVDDGNLPGICFCDEGSAPDEDPFDLDLINRTPMWFNYQTVSIKRAGEGAFERFVLTPGDLEQDFSVVGPYGH